MRASNRLKLDPLFRQFHPARKRLVFGNNSSARPIGARDVFGRRSVQPAGTSASFKDGPNVFWNKPGISNASDACFLRLARMFVSIIKVTAPFFRSAGIST
jgi:hypothetical protein